MDTEKYRTGSKRFWAAIVDWIVFLPFLLVGQWIYKFTSNIYILFVWVTFLAFAPPIYSIILHYKYGQTIGKWVTNVKVMDLSEKRYLTLLQSLTRDSFYLLVSLVSLLYFGLLLTQTHKAESILSDYESFSDNPIFWWTLIELITMLTNAKRRAVHDFIANSVVLRTQPNSDKKLIPLNIPAYEFGDEDKRLALQIIGLKFSHVINPKPFALVFHFHINEQTTFQNLEDFLNTVPGEFQIEYFRPFDSEKSEAGTMVTVQMYGSDYCFYNRSHGQDKIWKAFTREALLTELFTYRQHQNFGEINVSRIGKKAIVGEKAY
ncbi:RDD family protein [Flavihumibacter solisilvae]|uniref:RDD domain-containing protein n=1 Tax=Flavihumibacter solisilvae TaxID=1349421 RepID=A0A0C1L709_9BACT|nr:RDD family protein [Flavihumibacter solisilvae]KIC95942.1 hypothetical protein OI18_03415 [Flavihumibacter solisilvae]